MGNHSWEVICVGYGDEPEYEDCRAIEEIGYKAPTLRRKKVDAAGTMIESGLSNFHIDQDGRKIPLQRAKDKYVYVRTLDEDSADDPLLDLPTIQQYKLEKNLKGK